MPNLSVKDVPEDLAQALRLRAARNHRSLQGELMVILEAAVASELALGLERPRQPAARRSFAEVADEFSLRFSKPLGGAMESAAIIRDMRDTHYGEAWLAAGVKDGHWPLQAGDSAPVGGVRPDLPGSETP